MDIDNIIGIISLIIAVFGSFTRKTLGKLLCALVPIVFCGQIFIAIDKNWSSISFIFTIASLLPLLVFLATIIFSENRRTYFIENIGCDSSEMLNLAALLTPILIYVFSFIPIFNNLIPQEMDFASYISYISTQKISGQSYLYMIQNFQISIFYILKCLTLIVSMLSILYSFIRLNTRKKLNFSDKENLGLLFGCIITVILISTNAAYQILYEKVFPLF